MSWDKRTPGTWELTQFDRPGTNGACTALGEFPSYRAAVEAARRIAKISKLEGGFHATYCRSNKREGATVDGYTSMISLEGPTEPTPHVEVRLSDGTVVWLEDLERELFELQARPVSVNERTKGMKPLAAIEFELTEIYDRLDEIKQWAEDEGYRAIEHKLEEAMGPLESAFTAASQYNNGALSPV